MKDSTALPGLEHLLSVCRNHDLRIKTFPPMPGTPLAGRQFLGQPLDPILAAVYRRFDGGMLGDLGLYGVDGGPDDIVTKNESMWEGAEERVRQIFRYGRMDSFAYYWATVPALADENGAQPVVYLDAYDEQPMYPIASNVDLAFDLYARYQEIYLAKYAPTDWRDEEPYDFPLNIQELIAKDRPLVEMLEKNRFDHLMLLDAETLAWIAEIRRFAREAR